MQPIVTYTPQFKRIFSRNPQLSDKKPSVFAEENVIIPNGKGKLNYDFNPYCREIIDTLAPDHPARKIAVMKGSQITFSSGVIMPALGYIIKEDPHNTLLMVGRPDLIKPAIEKLDFMIDSAGLRDYISNQSKRKIKNKSGDTDEFKYFSGGYIKLASLTNPTAIAQIDLGRIFLDDFDAMKGNDKKTGNFLDLIEMRAASNMNTYKLMMISTPLLKSSSNIEPAFLAGDRRRYFVECPCCHEPIIFKWNVAENEVINPLTNEIAKGNGGIIFEKNNHGQLDKKTVGYVCYKCAGFFTDKNKQNQLREGMWKPTAIPQSDDYFSFHIPSLYAPAGIFNWAYYAGKYIAANPGGAEPRDEYKMQTLTNTCWGETYEAAAESPKATSIMRNIRKYEIGIIPEKTSIADGNGKIVLLTCGADMNGTVAGINKATENDARLDYEIVAWADSGASYSIKHGSIGTFVPRENSLRHKEDRARWTYEHGKENSVWPEFNKILREVYVGDTGRYWHINMPGLDCGAYSDQAHTFLDWTIGRNPENPVVGVRGNKEDRYVARDGNLKLFDVGKYRNDVYFLQVGVFKEMLANQMKLRWEAGAELQPPNFMNFPQPANGLYGYENFFEHYESEHRTEVTNKDGSKAFRWEKVNTGVQNHLWDCRVYNMALREIIVWKVGLALGEKEFRWVDYVNYVTG